MQRQGNVFYFNTGVKKIDNPHIPGGIDSGNGIIVIPFSCDNIPENSEFLYASDSEIPYIGKENIIKGDIYNTEMKSRYAYFKLIVKND